MTSAYDLYENRRLVEGYPGLADKAHEGYMGNLDRRPTHMPFLRRLLTYLDRLADVNTLKNVLVIGCGPEPETVRFLLENGFNAFGVEPVPSFVRTACEYLGDESRVRRGAAECLPFPDGSQDMILLESVLEHVESPLQSIREAYRALRPGGILYVGTSNRLKFSLTGRCGEFRVRFYNWLPTLVRECYVFRHLHYDPRLANYTERPAVHWFCFSELCSIGRDAGFAQFYSLIDLVRRTDESIRGSWFRKVLLKRIQLSPWLRALALTQIGGTIIMLKRRE